MLALVLTGQPVPLAGSAAYAQRPPVNAAAAAPAGLAALMAKATDAVNARSLAALTPLADGEANRLFGWVQTASTKVWQGDILPVPTPDNAQRQTEAETRNPKPETRTYLAVFHAWHTCESDGDHVHRLTHTAQGWRLGAEIPETETLGFRVRDHDLNVAFDIPGHAARIRDRVRIERTAENAPAFALLRISQDFHVRQFAREKADGPTVPFRQAGGILAFAPPAQKTFTLFLKYDGVVNHRDSDYILENEATLDSYWYPHIARLPATATCTATAPPGWTPIAQGEPVRTQRNADGSLTVTCRNDLPTCFFTLDAGRYTLTTRQFKGRTLTTCLLTPNPTLSQRCLDQLQSALEFYETHFGPFPYTRYSIVQTLGPFGGALEAYSFATFGPGPFTLPGAIPHELAHTWWGGLVPCTYTRSMWDESFAEYSDSLFRRMTRRSEGAPASGGTGLLRQRRSAAQAFRHFPMTQAFDTSDGRQSAVGYGKGAFVLRMLEEQIGQETMLRCMQAFLKNHPRGEAAEWPDFEAAVNQVTGQNYRWFFAQWTERKDLPQVWLTGVKTRQEGAETVVEGDIVQEGMPYRMRMPVRLETKEGGRPVTAAIEVQGPRTHFVLRADAPPLRMSLDPDGTLLLAPPDDALPDTDVTTYEFPQDVG
jgi:aminopeptidase N